jgi:hypothetical protein
LKAKNNGDADLLSRSRFSEFEIELEHLLTEERGAISLNVQVNKILSASAEILKAIDMRFGALQMDESEFSEKYENAKKSIAEIRENREAEFRKIEISAEKAYDEIKPQAESFWGQLQENAYSIIDNAQVSGDDIKKENIEKTQERLMKELQDSSENLGQLLSEKIQHSINSALGEEAVRLQDFESNFFKSVTNIQYQFSSFGEDNKSIGDLAISTAANSFLLMGLGGAYQGFKAAGWKGALLGGAVGFGATYGSLILLASLAIPVTLPLAIAAAFAGAIASKFAIGKFFTGGDKHVQKFIDQLKDAAEKRFSEMKNGNDMSVSLRSQIDTSFDAIKQKISTETENILRDTEAVLIDLQEKVLKNRLLAEKEKKDLEDMIKDVNGIGEKASALNETIVCVLNK